MCGKDLPRSTAMITQTGSPPHVRERQPATCEPSTHAGITPACAGKTFCLASEKLLIRDHPRMCGKDRHTGRYPRKGIGSPPHVRERRLVYNIRTGGRRITPACAGKTEHRLSWSCLSKDHPRMCGKDIGKKVSFSYLLGSPPHVRERRWRTGKPARKSRITPACAGKTDSQARLVRSAGDHPRMCGKDPG